MIIYLLPLLFLLLLTFLEQNNKYKIILKNKYFYFIIFTLFLIFIGLRDQIGCDWNAYESKFNYIKSQNLGDFLQTKQFLHNYNGIVFAIISRILSYKFSIHALVLFYSIIFAVPLFIFSYHLKNTYLSLAISYPYYIVVVGMGPLRQSAAISLIIFSVLFASKNKYNLFLINTIISFITHYSSLLVNSFIFLSSNFSSKWMINNKIKILLSFLIIIIFALNFSYIHMTIMIYIKLINTPHINQANSAFIIWFINFIPTIIYLLNVNKFNLKKELSNIFNSLAIFEILSLLIIPLNSVIAYRLILYCFPLSIYITSYLPEVNIIRFRKNTIIYGISFFSLISLLIWLKQANHVNCWLPYKNILLIN